MNTGWLIGDLELELEVIEGQNAASLEDAGVYSGHISAPHPQRSRAIDVRGIYERMGESIPRVFKVLTFFCEGSRELLDVLKGTGPSSDVSTLYRVAHSIKSLFQEVGAEACATVAAEAESLAQQGKREDAYKLIVHLPKKILYTARIVEELLERVSDSNSDKEQKIQG